MKKKARKEEAALPHQDLEKISGGSARMAAEVFVHAQRKPEPKTHEVQEKKPTAHWQKKPKSMGPKLKDKE